MIERHRKKTKIAIRRTGEKCKILRESGGTKNYAGKTTGSQYSPVKDDSGSDIIEYIATDFSSGLEESITAGGSYDTGNPTLLVAEDSVIQETDRVIVSGLEVEAKNVLNKRTHKVVNTVTVDG